MPIRHLCPCHEPHVDVLAAVGAEMLPDEELCDLSDFFKIFADSTRLKVIWALDRRALCVGELADLLGMTCPAISHQLKILKAARVVRSERHGRHVYYALADHHVKDIVETGREHIHE